MRINKLYINNFGKLSNYSLDLGGNLTVINEENGFGKSTLCAFIKAMFYGLSSSRSKDLNENERAKFLPWQGGAFGGSLEFSCKKGDYRIERTFGVKAASDTCVIYDTKTGKITDDFSANVGEELFLVDVKGFERSVFVDSALKADKMPISVSSRLSGLVDNTDDLSDFETAQAILTKRLRQYSTTGHRGIVYDKKREAIELKQKREKALGAKEKIDELSEKLSRLKSKKEMAETELKKVREAISKNAGFDVIKEKQKHYNSLLNNVETLKQNKQNKEQKYGEMPKESDVLNIEKCFENVAVAKQSLADNSNKTKPNNVIISIIVYLIAALLLVLAVVFDLKLILITIAIFLCVLNFSVDLALKQKKKKSELKAEQKLNDCLEALDMALSKFNIEYSENYSETVSALRSDLLEYNIISKNLVEAENLAKQYFEEEKLETASENMPKLDTDELKSKEGNLTYAFDTTSAEILRLSADIERLELASEELSDIEYNLEIAINEYNKAVENYNAINKGIEILNKAKENLSTKYKYKIEQEFIKTIEFLSDGRINDAVLSNDLDVSVREVGLSRNIESFSTGTKALVEIALRLSLIEALFEDEKSFIIFDDTFVHLDDKIFAILEEKIKILSEKNQIIYLTCTKSRTF